MHIMSNPRLGRTLNRVVLTLKKNVPTLTTIASIIGVGGTFVFSARAAYKSIKAIDEHKDKMEQLRADKDSFEEPAEYNKEVVDVYKKTGIEMLKVYWPALLFSGLTMVSILATNSVYKKRYLTMAGMYTTAVAAYNEYRKRVAAKYGSEAEKELFYNIKKEEIVTVKTDKKGKEKTTVEVVKTPGAIEDPNYSLFVIKQGCPTWHYNKPQLTYYRLTNIEVMFTTMLRSRGYVFLNEVLRELQLPEIPEGQVIGWIYDPDKGETDNCVDFAIREDSPRYDRENVEDFLDGKSDFIYINMNHDGTIYDRFPLFDRIWIRNTSGRV